MSDLKVYQLLQQIADVVTHGNNKETELLTGDFNTSVQTLVRNANVSSDCPDILFINKTPDTVLVNGSVFIDNYELAPGDFLAINGNNAERNRYIYNVVFGSAATKCSVVKRLYTKR